ncbi:MAG: YceI family protein [Bacteroidota bacterium]
MVRFFGLTLIFFIVIVAGLPCMAQGNSQKAVVEFKFPSKNVEGTIAGFQSMTTFDWNDLENSEISGTVAVSTIETGNFLRDWHLKRSAYFNSKQFPKIIFRSTSLIKTETGLKVSGNLTIKGITKPWQITFKREGNDLIGAAKLYSSDFDINIKKKREDNLVEVVISLTFPE